MAGYFNGFEFILRPEHRPGDVDEDLFASEAVQHRDEVHFQDVVVHPVFVVQVVVARYLAQTGYTELYAFMAVIQKPLTRMMD